MPGLGRMSSPVPQPVSVTSSRTGKFLVASGSDPQPGFPPGPPLAATSGQVVRVHVRVVAQQQRDVELQCPAVGAAPRRVAAVVQIPLGALQKAGVFGAVLEQQRRRGLQRVDGPDEIVPAGAEQVGSGRRQADRVEQQRIQLLRVFHHRGAGGARGVQDGQDVVGGRVIGAVEACQGTPVPAKGVAARVERPQHLVEVGGGLTDPFALPAHAVGDRAQHRIELQRIDHVEQVDDVLEDRVDLGADILGLQYRARGQPPGAGIPRYRQLDVLGAERGRGVDPCLHVGRDIPDLIGVDLQPQAGRVRVVVNLADPPHLYAAQHDLGAAVHHQPGSLRGQRHRHIRPEGAGEGRRRHEHEHRDRREQDQRPPRVVHSVCARPATHTISSPGGSWATGRRSPSS